LRRWVVPVTGHLPPMRPHHHPPPHRQARRHHHRRLPQLRLPAEREHRLLRPIPVAMEVAVRASGVGGPIRAILLVEAAGMERSGMALHLHLAEHLVRPGGRGHMVVDATGQVVRPLPTLEAGHPVVITDHMGGRHGSYTSVSEHPASCRTRT
jgi:hypothetical protein